MFQYNSKTQNYIKLTRRILQMPIHEVNEELIDKVLSSYFNEEDKQLLIDSLVYDIVINEKHLSELLRYIRNPQRINKLIDACDNLIYIGTDLETNEDQYLNFYTAGNIYVRGGVGTGKTWYFAALHKRLRAKERYKKCKILIWSGKSFEYEHCKDAEVFGDEKQFLKAIEDAMNEKDSHIIIFIDGLSEFLYLIGNQKNWLLSKIRNAYLNDTTFICSTQIPNFEVEDQDDLFFTDVFTWSDYINNQDTYSIWVYNRSFNSCMRKKFKNVLKNSQ